MPSVNSATNIGAESVDQAAVFAAAVSLWQQCQKQAKDSTFNLSDCYSGMDGVMREVMRISVLFETWSCQHVVFEEFTDVWPYLLQDSFGEACIDVISLRSLGAFDETDCLRVAIHLELPVCASDKLLVPIDLQAPNPIQDSDFRAFQIQTIHYSNEDSEWEPFTPEDDPCDERFDEPLFGLYGINREGRLEHIANRRTYAEVLNLVRNLAPGVSFPTIATFKPRPARQGLARAAHLGT